MCCFLFGINNFIQIVYFNYLIINEVFIGIRVFKYFFFLLIVIQYIMLVIISIYFQFGYMQICLCDDDGDDVSKNIESE